MEHPEISVVVCTRNRADHLRHVLSDLEAQELDGLRYEILVVDNGSTDATASLALSVSRDTRFRWIEEPSVGLSHARNKGWREARGRYVGYTDDDCRIPPGWLTTAAAVIRREAPDVFGGPIEPRFNAPSPRWFRLEYLERSRGVEPRILAPGENLWGGNLFLKRELVEELGGFSPSLGMAAARVAFGEETALQHELRRRRPSAKFYYHPDLRVWHLERTEKLRWRRLAQRFVAKGRDVYLAAGEPTSLPSRTRILADLAKTTVSLMAQSLIKLVLRDRRRFPHYANYFYEEGSRYLRRLGRLGCQLRQHRERGRP